MTLPINFPKIYEETSLCISLGAPEADQKVICELAKRVSHLYSNLLTEQGQLNRSPTLRFYLEPRTFPPKDLVEKFQQLVEKAIINKLNDDEYNQSGCLFHVDSGVPEAEVGDALRESGIDSWNYDLVRCFPHKSFTEIEYNRENRTLKLKICQNKCIF